MSKFSRRSLSLGWAPAALFVVLAVAAFWATRTPVPSARPTTPLEPAATSAARAHAWTTADALLDEADREAAAALDRQLTVVHAFLAERKAGARPFAERLLGLRGKWKFVCSQFQGDDGGYRRFLTGAFEEHVFRGEELEQAVARAVAGFLAELDRIESDLLVRLRADLADDALLVSQAVPALASDQLLAERYRNLANELAPVLARDLAVLVGREVLTWQATNVATDIAIELGVAVAARLGVSAGVLSAGAASSWTTLGVGLVVGIVLDAVISQIIKAAGYDAEAQVAQRVGDALDDLARNLTEGNPQLHPDPETVRAFGGDDPDPLKQRAAVLAADAFESSPQTHGLRGELSQISLARSTLRRAVLRQLILDQEAGQ